MYDSGLFVNAEISNYSDYKSLGLRCIFCGEEVFLKKGKKRQSHFSHFKQLGNSPEKCPYRTSVFGAKTWCHITSEGRNQRRDIFQQYFLEIINLSYPLFFEKTDKILEKVDCDLDQLICFLKSTKRDMLLCLERKKDIADSKDKIFQKLVVMEVIDYLYLPHTINLFLKIIYFIIKENNDLSRREYLFWILNQNHVQLCDFTIDFLLNVNWLNCLESYANDKIKKSSLNSNKKVSSENNISEIKNHKVNNTTSKVLNNDISEPIMIKVPTNGVLYESILSKISDNNTLLGTIKINRLGIISFLPHRLLHIQSTNLLIIGKVSNSSPQKWHNKIQELKVAELIESNKIDEAIKVCLCHFGGLSDKISFEGNQAYFSDKLIAYAKDIPLKQNGYYPCKVIITKGYIDRKNKDKYTQKFDITSLFQAPHIHSAIHKLIKKWNRIYGKHLKDIKKMLSKILDRYKHTDASTENIDIILKFFVDNNPDLQNLKTYLLPGILYIKGSENIDHYKRYQEICQYLDNINL